jgi:hypothetical protein
MREDREDRSTCSALDTPDGEPTQPDTGIMGVARETSTAATGRLVFELKAQGQHEGKDTLEKGFAITKQLHVGGFILEIDGDRPVFAGLASGVAHGSPSGQMVDADR